ncbi:MAG: DUF3291 domain-containing protein [Actinomycetota bacterium]
MTEFHLAQVNVARLSAPLDSPQLADFVANLDPINAIADASHGFVWRLQTDAGDATALRVFDDDWLIVNMSVWKSLEALRNYVYRSSHAGVLRRRQEWFDRMDEAHVALWWIEAGTLPTLSDAQERFLTLRAEGPTPRAFTL